MIKLFRFLKKFTWLVLAVIGFMFLQAIAELYLPTLMSDIVNNGMMKGDTAYIWKRGGYMLLVAGLSSLSSIVGAFLSARVAVGFGRILRDNIFTRAERFSLHEFDKIGTASMITRTTNDINQVQMVLVMMMRFIIYSPIMCIGGIIMAYSKDRYLTLVLAGILPLFVATIVLIAVKVIPLFKSLQKKLDKVNQILRENLIGIRVIRAFNRIDTERKRFYDANRDLTDTAIKVNKIMAVMQPIMILLMNFTSISIIWFASKRIGENRLQIGDMMAFLQYALQILFSIIMVSIMFVMIPRAQASAERINEIFEIEPEINDPKEPKKIDEFKGHIEFKKVTFSYPGAETPAIEDISFEAKPGEVTAIIGGTGSGKSTILNLIMRFYDVDSGNILIDGVDVKELEQRELRSYIGYVPQNAILFSGTIADNIRYGKEDATDEEIRHAAEIAQAIEFINEMKDGFNSLVSQGGTNLSGGQKQRLSIARAIVKKPKIYIFDDSFSALDFKTDANLRLALKNETTNSTVLIVAQRVATIMDADKIIVLDDGRIVGIGKHKELLKTCEVYREIVSSQLSEEEIA